MMFTTHRLPTEWDAGTYHRVSDPQLAWGQKIVRRLALTGAETIVDAGCGSGRLTAKLLELVPGGHVFAIDRSRNMLDAAAAHLVPRFGDRVTFVQADIQNLSLPYPVDVIFSTATFHWILDHQRLFQRLYDRLKPGGRLVAQCGGGPNIARLSQRAETLLDSPAYRDAAAGWSTPWEFASPEQTSQRLRNAGFVDSETSFEHAPTTFSDAEAYREFVQAVVLRAHLDALPEEAMQIAFMDTTTELAAGDEPPFTLDYWRLNLSATRPPTA
ncbi:MAG: methyltransferase domain-containing protein [Chloroflexia bacterium]|nr:methyltransferase domain-containing protein [Chloroflexia bacterium]